MKKKNDVEITGIIFSVFGAIAFALLLYGIISVIKLTATYDKVKATIVEVYPDSGCKVEFTYDDKEYKAAEQGYYSSKMKVGRSINVYVNPDNPYKIKLTGSYTLFITLGAVFFLVFGGIGILLIIKGRTERKCTEWEFIMADVIGVELHEGVAINGICPFRIRCRYLHPETKENIYFYSKDCIDDPGDVYRRNEKIKVYIKDSTMKKYVVDLSKMREYGLE